MSLKELIASYDAATSVVEEKKLDLERAVAARSDIVKMIATEILPKKKFLRGEKLHTIVVRGSTWFLRGSKSEEGLVDVDA
jgi:hypothetical protein